MASNNKAAKRAHRKDATRTIASAEKPDSWPVVWRVVAPSCGNYGHDMVFLETGAEVEARERYRNLRRTGWPVRLERIHCGPLPTGATENLKRLHALNAQSPGSALSEIQGYWTKAPRRGKVEEVTSGDY